LTVALCWLAVLTAHAWRPAARCDRRGHLLAAVDRRLRGRPLDAERPPGWM